MVEDYVLYVLIWQQRILSLVEPTGGSSRQEGFVPSFESTRRCLWWLCILPLLFLRRFAKELDVPSLDTSLGVLARKFHCRNLRCDVMNRNGRYESRNGPMQHVGADLSGVRPFQALSGALHLSANYDHVHRLNPTSGMCYRLPQLAIQTDRKNPPPKTQVSRSTLILPNALPVC